MAKIRIFAAGADVRYDQPLHWLASRHRVHLEVRVSRNELVQIDERTFQEIDFCKLNSYEPSTERGYDAAVTSGKTVKDFREAWALKPSAHIFVWQLKTPREKRK